jgi:ABC-2 type transport system ATP-binding protein
MLRLTDVSKVYAKSETKAVDGLNLELNKGEIYGFLGPNGAGKTTTIKMITGIVNPTSGSIEICGKNLADYPEEAKRNIGYVSDSHIVYDKLTGREYVDFMACVYGVSAQDKAEREEKLVSLFRLTDAYDSQISTYSHGMKQKINVIGALIHEPPLWILDEPMTGLDPESAHELKTLMREHCDKGNTVFFSTHVLEVAEKLCDRVGIINKGKLIAQGTVEEIRGKATDGSLESVFLTLTEKEEK